MIMSKETLIKSIREIPDFPIPGILFYDVTTLFKDPWCLQELSNIMFEMYKDKGITKVVGIESRGFIMGGALCDIVVGVDIEPIIIFIGQDECTEGSIYIELRLYIKIELAVRFDDLITEREISRGEMSRRGDLFTAQMIQQFAPLIIARRELRPCGMVHRR